MYVNATLVSGSWTVTGASLPTFPTNVTGITYYIFAQAIDGANNLTPQPGPPTRHYTSQMPDIQVVLQTPPPQSAITSRERTPNLRPNAITLQGTAINATTDQVQIIDCGGTSLAGAGMTIFTGRQRVGVDHERRVPDQQRVYRRHRLQHNDAGLDHEFHFRQLEWEPQIQYHLRGQERSAVLDSDHQYPNGSLYHRFFRSRHVHRAASCADLHQHIVRFAANISDTPAGQVSSTVGDVDFTAKQQATSNFWDWTLSTFTASGSNTELVAATTGSYTNGLDLQHNDLPDCRGDAAGWRTIRNPGLREGQGGQSERFDALDFTYDVSKPTATIVVPQNGLMAVNSLAIASGTAVDNNVNANVKIAIYSPSDRAASMGAASRSSKHAELPAGHVSVVQCHLLVVYTAVEHLYEQSEVHLRGGSDRCGRQCSDQLRAGRFFVHHR